MSEKIEAPVSSVDAASGPKENTSTVPKAIIKNVDMSEEMQQESVDVASVALEKFNIEKDIAAQIKKEFDRRHGPTWHVVVGKNFGSYVTHGKLWPHGRRVDLFTNSPITRNQTFHLLLHRFACDFDLEVVNGVADCYLLRCEQVPSRSLTLQVHLGTQGLHL